ncbi:MAG: aspartate/tyrosine/aromatic aminotransferase [Candidatus Accumulibacter phosphatis]|uniref:Aminotransferase n=1 Tax=Candidatus Accumulibacter cognatus TaxID=2954383 RepID=A0A080M4N4_9PROT|nr:MULTISPECIES: amino acid aminotransferase [Candidatus Accumulibacter]MCC2869122.1 aspartate/tyrosine/aromatic aminotransferase [Candidatus Accumulibacter phosphatis]KFB76016.1 MAG: Aromatic-amino-acid aminotransferase [Candidatus Accumulibacter cognatus]MBL8400704.1 aspartate/tyrosine/aromatic aminotransferase [Accumulibacter sp.]MBN8516857.1 aspartate/tyrosine/aromatic aminotransferase [Accumulibacter sp.]MBO3710578.1 aspartate/tyrosine/aromatic aminotransferase [Accumulibacter sp.]
MTASIFAAVEMAPRDPILGLTESFNADGRSTKVNLGVGVYLDGSGKVPLLAAVKLAEKARLEAMPPRGYQPIDGLAAYNQNVQKLLFGADSALLAEGRVLTIEALGGTGALKVGADYLRRLLPEATVYLSDPSWENHRALFENVGFTVATYPYYDPATHGVNFAAMQAGLNALPTGSIVVLHACCHNPTGADLDEVQWRQVIEVIGARGLLAFVDIAYQGFADGLVEDALALRLFAESGLQFLVASSFSKSFSLYGERVGALSVITANRDESARVLSQIKRIVRTNYSSPPTHGGAIVSAVLSSPELRRLWEEELAEMRGRIRAMRLSLVDRLKGRGVSQDYSFVIRQRGMFSYTGLSAEQVNRMCEEFGIYAVSSGRICLAALNTHNIDYVADAIAAVL